MAVDPSNELDDLEQDQNDELREDQDVDIKVFIDFNYYFK